MKQNFDLPIDELKYYLTLQMEAFHQGDWTEYDRLEKDILRVEGKL